MQSDALPTHSLELRPYIEEPSPRIVPSSHANVNHRPKMRHDFQLSKQECVDAYWETLKYCYLSAGLAEPSAFPGCCVPEVCHQCYTSLHYLYLYLTKDLFWLHIYRHVLLFAISHAKIASFNELFEGDCFFNFRLIVYFIGIHLMHGHDAHYLIIMISYNCSYVHNCFEHIRCYTFSKHVYVLKFGLLYACYHWINSRVIFTRTFVSFSTLYFINYMLCLV